MIKIENKEQIYSGSFLAINNQEVLVDVPLGGSTLNLGINFLESPLNSEREATWETINGIIKFSFRGWNNSLGTCVLEPIKFGDFGNRKIFFQLAHHYMGEINFAHLFIYLGGENE